MRYWRSCKSETRQVYKPKNANAIPKKTKEKINYFNRQKCQVLYGQEAYYQRENINTLRVLIVAAIFDAYSQISAIM